MAFVVDFPWNACGLTSWLYPIMMGGVQVFLQGVFFAVFLPIVWGMMHPSSSAAESENSSTASENIQVQQKAYERLKTGLEKEVALLEKINDHSSAQSNTEPLRRLLADFAAQRRSCNEEDLWRYIDNTPDMKQPLVEQIELLFLQLQRIRQANYYGNAILQRLLATQIFPAVKK